MPLSNVTVIWSMIASACLTLAALYLLVWLRNRGERASLFFSINAVSMAAFAFCELWLMRVQTPAEAVIALRWAHVALLAWLMTNVWFVKSYLRAGKTWLAWTILGIRVSVLPFNFLPGQNLTFRQIDSLDHVRFLGDVVTVPNGVVNPLQTVTVTTVAMILWFIADAGVTAWRRGERRKALVVATSLEIIILAATANALPTIFGLVRAPLMFSLPYMVLVLAMAYELSRDVLRASQLVSDLRASEAGLRENQARLEASNQQISSLFGRLIAAQETERTRIARDLHDDIGQRIAGISIAMSGVKRKLDPHHPALEALTAMQRETIALADGVRHVSHELHPTVLQHAGLVEALRGLCAQYQKLHGTAVDYRAEPDLDAVPHDAALALYRVAQEALRNVSKHAAASRVEVALTRVEDGVQLSIVDDGRGFNLPDHRGRADGLGLRSIDERVRFLRGRVDIKTAAGHGTRLQVRIPLELLA
jgi:signal transduction histidine kinase